MQKSYVWKKVNRCTVCSERSYNYELCTRCYVAKKEERRAEVEAERKGVEAAKVYTRCQGYNCKRMTEYRFCKSCFELNKQYVYSAPKWNTHAEHDRH